MDKKISIIVPCYNVEKYIDRCLHSLTRQTIGVEQLEIICVDDASTDGTVEKLKEWESRYEDSIMVILCEENGRQGTARNIAISYASAPYIGYVDSDDWVELTMYEELYREAVNNDTEVTSCLGGRDRGDGKIFSKIGYGGEMNKKIQVASMEERRKLFRGGLGPIWTKIYKKEFLLEHGIYFLEGVAYEDNFFEGLTTFYVDSFYIMDKVGYHYFANMDSTITRRNSPQHYERLVVEKRLREELEERGFMEGYSQEINERFLRMFYLNSLHTFLTKFDVLPYEWLEETKKVFLQCLPDYKKLSAYRKLSDLEKAFLLPLEREMTRELWDNMARNYHTMIVADKSRNRKPNTP